MPTLEEKLENLPLLPGVYRFFGERGDLLYVGKAKRLRNRVRSYFQESRSMDGRLRVMVSKIRDLEVIVTDSEAEALLLENTLIKELQPRYNIMYRDDKSYPYICFTPEERPRVYPTRTPIRDGSRYFGPYDHVGHMQRTLDMIRATFDLCTCAVSSRNVDKNRGAPKWHTCLDAYLGRCSADLPLDLYKDRIRKVERMLSGKTEQLHKEIKEEMEIASSALDFETAAQLRDSLTSLRKFSEKMKVIAGADVNQDLFVLAVSTEIDEACGVMFKVREGRLIGSFHRYLKNIEDVPRPALLQSFMEDYYTGQHTDEIPDEILLGEPVEDAEPLLSYLSQAHGRKVRWIEPKIGEKRQLVSMALANATFLIGQREIERSRADKDRIPSSLKDLQTYLGLSRLPRRIECFDNSNIQGSDAVASMVCFVDAKPRKASYKKFAIKTVVGPDDFASMREVLTRRYSRLMKEGGAFPDLIVVDGGKGQLSAAVEALEKIGALEHCDIIGLAKRLEEVFLPGKSEAVMIPRTSAALKVLQQARDEAHRFAITFHREKRSKRTLTTELTEIEGIGQHTAKKLLSLLGSVKNVSKATQTELQEILGEKKGADVFSWFRNKEATKKSP